jgi:hypothetical protein
VCLGAGDCFARACIGADSGTSLGAASGTASGNSPFDPMIVIALVFAIGSLLAVMFVGGLNENKR